MPVIPQSIEHPFGITVFGSAVMRVEPDIASLRFSVSRLAQQPKEAFDEVRKGAQSVQAFLAQTASVNDVGTSRVTLAQTSQFSNGESRFIGYTATVAFEILLRDLDRREELLSGVIDAGANQLGAFNLQTSQLKAHRAEVRRRAVQAAQEKAQNYCAAASVTLGLVIHIEDVSPDMLSVNLGHGGSRETPVDDEATPSAIDPESIAVSAAVMMAFEFGH